MLRNSKGPSPRLVDKPRIALYPLHLAEEPALKSHIGVAMSLRPRARASKAKQLYLALAPASRAQPLNENIDGTQKSVLTHRLCMKHNHDHVCRLWLTPSSSPMNTHLSGLLRPM